MSQRLIIFALLAVWLAVAIGAGSRQTQQECTTDTECAEMFGGDGGPEPAE